MKASVCFDSNETSPAFDSSNAGRSRTAERVDDKIAGLTGAEHDWADEGQWELGGEIGQTFAAVFDETRNAPDVVPEFAVRVGSRVGVFGLAVGRPRDGIGVEDEAAGVFDAVENVPRAAIEVVRAVHAEGLVPLDP